jgi:hypothetical protein
MSQTLHLSVCVTNSSFECLCHKLFIWVSVSQTIHFSVCVTNYSFQCLCHKLFIWMSVSQTFHLNVCVTNYWLECPCHKLLIWVFVSQNIHFSVCVTNYSFQTQATWTPHWASVKCWFRVPKIINQSMNSLIYLFCLALCWVLFSMTLLSLCKQLIPLTNIDFFGYTFNV